jgi:hypothetical protein
MTAFYNRLSFPIIQSVGIYVNNHEIVNIIYMWYKNNYTYSLHEHQQTGTG